MKTRKPRLRAVGGVLAIALAACASASGGAALGSHASAHEGDRKRPEAPPADPSEPAVGLELLAEHASVRPGGSASLALRFVVQPGWHVYWTNPGDGGAPPTVRWDLPEGFRAGPLAFPVPKRLEEGPIVTFVHEGEVLLPVEVAVPTTVRAGDSVAVAADVTWLVCSNVCVPMRRTVRAALRVEDRNPLPDPGARDVFAAARRALPAPLPAGPARAWRDGARLVLDLAGTGLSPGKGFSAEFFPSEDGVVTFEAARAEDATIVLAARRAEARAGERLRGVLAVGTEHGREGHEIDVPVAAKPAAGDPEEE